MIFPLASRSTSHGISSWGEFVSVQEARPSFSLKYRVDGHGPPVVLLHGFGATSYTWNTLEPVLAPHFTVYSVDLKGFGNSPKPDDDAYSLYDHANAVYSFLQDNRLFGAPLVGHSFGGGVALLLSLRLRDSNHPAALVLIDSIAYPQTFPLFIGLLRTPLIGWLGSQFLPAELQVRSVLNVAYHNSTRIDPDTVRAYAKPLSSGDARRAARITAVQLVPGDMEKLTARYGEIRAPTLLVWGHHDEIVPLWVGKKLQQVLPNSSLYVVEDAGHVPHEEQPALVTPIIRDFLVQKIFPND